MSKKQAPVAGSGQTSQQLLTSFHVDREKWERFGVLAKMRNRSRGAQLREMIDRALEAELEQAA